jgi:hypothetical protein
LAVDVLLVKSFKLKVRLKVRVDVLVASDVSFNKPTVVVYIPVGSVFVLFVPPMMLF